MEQLQTKMLSVKA